MSYYLYDEDGYVGDLASIEGYGELTDTIQKGNYPQLKSLVQKGMTLAPGKVHQELKALLISGRLSDKSVRDTVFNMQKLMAKEIQKEIVIVGE